MFQEVLNNLTEKKLFDLENTNPSSNELFVCSASEDNKYTRYLKGIDGEVHHDLSFMLEAMSYNTFSNYRQWRMKRLEYDFYDMDVNSKLPEDLCKKIKNSLKPEFKEKVKRLLEDYHILLNVNDEPIPVEEYPDVFWAAGYFEAFPITYFDIEITDKETEIIAAALNDRSIIINTGTEDNVKVIQIDEENRMYTISVPISGNNNVESDVAIALLSKKMIDYWKLTKKLQCIEENKPFMSDSDSSNDKDQ